MEQVKRSPNCIEYFETEQEIKKRKSEEFTVEEVAQLWYESMIKDTKIETNEVEISQLWYELMQGGM